MAKAKEELKYTFSSGGLRKKNFICRRTAFA